MTSTELSVSRALLITLIVVLALSSALALVGVPERWPPVETPPEQGEAAVVSADTAHASHTPAALARLIREPQNTWSNIAFVFGGAWLAVTAVGRLARGTGVALIAVGVGSFLYHASAARALRHVDLAAMFWVFLMTGALCGSAVFPGLRGKLEAHARTMFAATLLLAVGLAAARNVELAGLKPLSLRSALAAMTVVVIGTLALVARRRETISAALQLLGVVTLLGAALAFQTADRPGGRLFRPDAWVQAHAVWHVLAAATLAWVVRFIDRDGSPDSAAGGDRRAVDAKTETPLP